MTRMNGGGTDDVVGLDWSDGVITASRVELHPTGTIGLLNIGWAGVPTKATDRELAAAIRDVWRMSGMPSWTVAASLRSRSMIVRYFNYPALKRDELMSALRLEAEESLQLSQGEIALDYHLNHRARYASPAKGSESQPYSGLMVAVPLKEVQHHLSILRMADLYPIVIDLGATAAANLFQVMQGGGQACQDVCLLHLTSQSADIVMLFEGDGLYARTLNARGANWDVSLGWLLEGIQDAFNFFIFKLRGQPVRRLAVAGVLPKSPDFLSNLQARMEVPVEVWNPLTQVKSQSYQVRRRLAAATPPPMSISMGLALRRYTGD